MFHRTPRIEDFPVTSWTFVLTLLAGFALSWFSVGMEAGSDKLPRLPRAALLVGYPPGSLKVTTADNTWTLDGQGGWLNISPSISRDGMVVGSARFVEMADFVGSDGIARREPRIAVATYSLIDKQWTDYGALVGSYGRIAIAPDGSRLAFTMVHEDNPRLRVHVIDLKTGSRRIMPARGYRGGVNLSWSPDSRCIAYDMNEASPQELSLHRPAIFVLDVETGTSTKIADGEAPAWSPSGEWIAYLDNSGNWETRTGGSEKNRWHEAPKPDRVSMVRPDGTGSRVLVTLGKDRVLGVLFPVDRIFRYAPVWAPDSTTLLLNEFVDWDKGTFDVHLLNLSTLKTIRKFKRTPPVFGWAEAK
jgi:hypothetical protein